MIYDAPLTAYNNGFSFITEDNASDIATAFLNGENVILHLYAEGVYANEYIQNTYLTLLNYEVERTDGVPTGSVAFSFCYIDAISNIAAASSIDLLNGTSVTENDKLAIALYSDNSEPIAQ